MILTLQDKEEARKTIYTVLSYGFKEGISYHLMNSYGAKHYFCNFSEWKKDAVQKLANKNISIHSGASKVCIHKEDSGWVIKANFMPNPNYPEDQRYDYCAYEADFYARAVEKNCAEHLAATYFFEEVDGVKFYLQEYAETDSDEFDQSLRDYASDMYCDNTFEDEEEREDCISAEVEEFNEEDIIHAILGYNSEAEALINFVYKNDINDLHAGNWGKALDGRIIIIDYSGYKG